MSHLAVDLKPGRIDSILDQLRTSGRTYYYVEFASPWGVDLAGGEGAAFHSVEQGKAYFRGQDGPWLELEKGDLVLVGPGVAHSLAEQPRAHCMPLEQLASVCVPSPYRSTFLCGEGQSAVATMLCSLFDFVDPAGRALLAAMLGRGGFQVFRAVQLEVALSELLWTIARISYSRQSETGPVIDRLLDVVMRLLMRQWLQSIPQARLAGFLVIQDPDLARLLTQLESDPFAPWTLEKMAKAASLSRSRLAERFAFFTDLSPGEFLRMCRLEWVFREQPSKSKLEELLKQANLNAPHFIRTLKRYQQIMRAEV